MDVLIACESSQVVCTAFRAYGHNAFSCDLVPCYGGHKEWHIVGDAARIVNGGVFCTESLSTIVVPHWDLLIAHPPCTMLTHSSAVAYSKGLHTDEDIERARCFFLAMLNAPVAMVAVENPAPMSRAALPPYTQIIQPFQFGHPYSKRVCLWLRNLPPLLPTTAEMPHQSWVKHCAGNSRRRSHFWSGIAGAMAAQWGTLRR